MVKLSLDQLNSFQSRFTDTFLKRQRAGKLRLGITVACREHGGHPTLASDEYVGQYELAPNFALTITKEQDKLMSQATGQPKFELLPESEIGFFIKDFSALFIFLRNRTGKVDRLITVQDGRIVPAKRIK